MIFQGRNLIIATRHKKEEVIAPLLEAELGVNCFVDPKFDTDHFGTFSGEIERIEDPISTLRSKCLLAMEKNKCDLGVASEGSFGSHPVIPFASADDELLILIDKKNGLEIIARELSLETNLNGFECSDRAELFEFATKSGFPSHGLILKKGKNDYSYLRKGIISKNELLVYFNFCMSEFGSVYVETDMRAMYNPTRMKVIEKATKNLLIKLNSSCPVCSTPGYSVVSATSGLPCSSCRFPTSSTLFHTYKCTKCNHEEEIKFPNNKQMEDPMYCDMCNP
jgi:hypothetical protein